MPRRRALSTRMLVLILCGVLGGGSGTRVLSGQTVCYGGPEYPCYKIAYFQDLSRRIGFEEASQACEMDGGGLVSIRSATEQRLIENLLQDLTKSGSGLSDGDFWIGLRRSNEGQSPNTFGGCPDLYRWTDGSAAKFRNWYADEPSCGSEACVVMYHQLTAQPGLGGPYLYQWNDDRCNMKHNFVCKYASENLMTNESEEHVTSDYGIMPNVVYVIIPTIPLLLLLLVALATCCIQMLSRSKDRSKSSPNESTLWISAAPKKENLADV
ncbi:chondrolectin isoform X4 [Stegostoma tigrinum]|uniref:chondrolectin isoform X4 n=1 Tax=Stegostoma tigrinum TaxID=3053191 RepID=UPI00202B08F1|nr:chondrolectin isoform X4 [Stegostoma tigrinum]